jgi:hypothetical protein
MILGIVALIIGILLEYKAFTTSDGDLMGACLNFGIILIVLGAIDVWGT